MQRTHYLGLNNGTRASSTYSESTVYEIYRSQPLANSSIQNNSYLSKFRSVKANQNIKIGKEEEDKNFLPDVICNIFKIGGTNTNVKQQKRSQRQCSCGKTQDGLCQLIMGWIDDEYYWKTDKQFHKTYDYYQGRKLEQSEQLQLKVKLENIEEILGLQIGKQQNSAILQILSNYKKHTLYYNKYNTLIKNSDLFIWACLGICYHIRLTDPKNNKLDKTIAFWALDIAMDKFGNLQPTTFLEISKKAVRNFQYYFEKWLELFKIKDVKIQYIIAQWIRQAMFGYMGVESIAFFLDCFRKSGWDYLIKLMLSFFQFRTKQICKDKQFLASTIKKDQLIKLIIDGREEWPMIFCSASSFSIRK